MLPYVNFRSYIATTDLHQEFVLARVLDLKILHQRVLKSGGLTSGGRKSSFLIRPGTNIRLPL